MNAIDIPVDKYCWYQIWAGLPPQERLMDAEYDRTNLILNTVNGQALRVFWKDED